MDFIDQNTGEVQEHFRPEEEPFEIDGGRLWLLSLGKMLSNEATAIMALRDAVHPDRMGTPRDALLSNAERNTAWMLCLSLLACREEVVVACKAILRAEDR